MENTPETLLFLNKKINLTTIRESNGLSFIENYNVSSVTSTFEFSLNPGVEGPPVELLTTEESYVNPQIASSSKEILTSHKIIRILLHKTTPPPGNHIYYINIWQPTFEDSNGQPSGELFITFSRKVFVSSALGYRYEDFSTGFVNGGQALSPPTQGWKDAYASWVHNFAEVPLDSTGTPLSGIALSLAMLTTPAYRNIHLNVTGVLSNDIPIPLKLQFQADSFTLS